MKKILFFAAAVVMTCAAMSSCTGFSAKSNETVDSTAVDTVMVDSVVAADSTVVVDSVVAE